MLSIGGLSASEFQRAYWRKRPALFKGAAQDVLKYRVTTPRFRSICDRLEQIQPQAVARSPEALFGQNLDLASMRLKARSVELASVTSCKRVWFDGVFARSGGGIGSHWDHSDNLVVQQSGTKLWRLASPDRLTASELKARMLDDPGAGLVSMPDDCQEFILHPGDVLYIPLFWAHWGISQAGPSMSISAVFNADSALDLLLPLMREVLKDDRRWWTPLPQHLLDQDGPPAELNINFDLLLDAFSSKEFPSRLKSVWWRRGFLKEKPETVAGVSPYGRARKQVELESLGIDFTVLKDDQEEKRRTFDPKQLAQGDASGLLALRAAWALHKHARLLQDAAELFGESECIEPLLDFVRRYQGHAPAHLARPEYSVWLWRLGEAIGFQHEAYFEELGAQLPKTTSPELVRNAACPLFRRFPKGERFGAPKLVNLNETDCAVMSKAFEAGLEQLASQLASSLLMAVLPCDGAANSVFIAPNIPGAIACAPPEDPKQMSGLIERAVVQTAERFLIECGLDEASARLKRNAIVQEQ